MEKELLRIKNLYAEYRSDSSISKAVDGLDLTVYKGEALGLIGESRTGKTATTLSVMGLLPGKAGYITQEDIRYCGESFLNKKSRKLDQIRGSRISMIPTNPLMSLNPVLTVGHQIAMGLRRHRRLSKKETQQEVARSLEMVGIASYHPNGCPRQFSGGVRQRVGIAAALACSPEPPLVNKPATALDVAIQAQVLELMEELQKEYSASLVMITHNLGIIAELCQKVTIMYGGEIIKCGNVQEVFKDSKHWYTYGLLHTIPKLTERKQPLESIPGSVANPQNLSEGRKFHNRCAHCINRCEKEGPSLVKINGHHYAAYWGVPKSL